MQKGVDKENLQVYNLGHIKNNLIYEKAKTSFRLQHLCLP